MRRIEPEGDHGAAAAEDRRGGIRVGVDVVLGGRGDASSASSSVLTMKSTACDDSAALRGATIGKLPSPDSP